MQLTVHAIDSDVQTKSREELLGMLLTLRAAVRAHRDARGNDRCWLDDLELYRQLPEQAPNPSELQLPPRDEFLRNCATYHACRQPCGTNT